MKCMSPPPIHFFYALLIPLFILSISSFLLGRALAEGQARVERIAHQG